MGKVVLQGVGRLGSAILEGWLKTGTVAPSDLIILTPSSKPITEEARALGALVNPSLEGLSEVSAFVIGVKPAKWIEAAQPILPYLSPEAVIVSVMAGVRAETISNIFAGRRVVRIMPTTGVASARGVASIWADDAASRQQGQALFGPIADTVHLDSEESLHAATAVSGCGPAYFFYFTRALAKAGVEAGLTPEAAERLARATLRSSAAGLDGPASLDALIDRVASPGGVTQAGLIAMNENGALNRVVKSAVEAAVAKSTELSV